MEETTLRRAGIGLLGFGTVGQSFVRLVQRQAARYREAFGLDLPLVAIGNRDVERKRAAWAGDGVRWTEDLASVVDDPAVDLVVELMGGPTPARELIERALAAGKSVVTANKLLLASHGGALAAQARAHGASLGIEASVAGGIPILRALRESFVADRLESVSGILNGTCNYILTEMEASGRAYSDILKDAQRLGYAEADPESDVGGADAAYKLTLLSRMAFGQEVRFEEIEREGITRLLPCDFVYARQLGRAIRQLAVARRLPDGRLLLSVRTHLVDGASILAKVLGPFNAVRVAGQAGGEFVFYGRGAGGDPTATAVLSDVLEIARSGARPGIPPLAFFDLASSRVAGADEFIARFYLRFVVRDQPGIIASISRCLADCDINIDAVFQAPYGEKEALPFVITLEPVAESQLRRALVGIASLPFHAEPPLALPMTV